VGWWKTTTGEILGDGPLNILDEHQESIRWKRPCDFPADVLKAITEEYGTDLGRAPTQAELAALLALHHGDSRCGVIFSIRHQPPEP